MQRNRGGGGLGESVDAEAAPRSRPQSTPCRYGAECRNIGKCRFFHPISLEVPENGISTKSLRANNNSINSTSALHRRLDQSKSDHSNTPIRHNHYRTNDKSNRENVAPSSSAPPAKDRSKIQCRYGMGCRNRKCPFFHHPAAGSNGSTVSELGPSNGDIEVNGVRGSNGPLLPVPSKPDRTAARAPNNENNAESSSPQGRNPFQITVTTSSSASVATATSSLATDSRPHGTRGLPKRTNPKRKCRYGAGCRNKKCTFVHPQDIVELEAAPAAKEICENPAAQKKEENEVINNAKCDSNVDRVSGANSVKSANTPDRTRPVTNICTSESSGQKSDTTNHSPQSQINQTSSQSQIATGTITTGPPGFATSKGTSMAPPHQPPQRLQRPPQPQQLQPAEQPQQCNHPLQPPQSSDWLKNNIYSYISTVGLRNATNVPNPSSSASYSSFPTNASAASDVSHSTNAISPTSASSPTLLSQTLPEDTGEMDFSLRQPLGFRKATKAKTSSMMEQNSANMSMASIASQHNPQNFGSDSDWLFEVLGLKNEKTASSFRKSPMHDLKGRGQLDVPSGLNGGVVADRAIPSATNNDHGNSSNLSNGFPKTSQSNFMKPSSTPFQTLGTSKQAATDASSQIQNDTGSQTPPNKSLPEEDITKSRRAALELRLESQESGACTTSPEVFSTLLQTCRSKQLVVKAALETAMDAASPVESNLIKLLELNELLLSSIKVAESALPNSNTGVDGSKPWEVVDEKSDEVESRKKAVSEKINGSKGGIATKKSNEQNGKLQPSYITSTNPEKEKKQTGNTVETKSKQQGKTIDSRVSTKETSSSTSTAATDVNSKKSKKKQSKGRGEISQQQKSSEEAASTSPLHPAFSSFTKQSQEKPSVTPSEASQQETFTREDDDPQENFSTSPDPVHLAQQEKEKMARMLKEAREQQAAARERKKDKKSKKFDRWVREQEEMKGNRADSWVERIAKEIDYIDLIQKLIVAEFLRQSKSKAMGLTTERVCSDSDAAEVVAKQSRAAFHILFPEMNRRVVVAGSDKKDMNGRQGTIRYWDKDRKRFCVGLDTKKGTSDDHFLSPEYLEAVTLTRSLKPERKSNSDGYNVDISELLTYGGVSLGCSFTLTKSHVITLGSAEYTKVGLLHFVQSRDEEERLTKIAEEAERKREEEDRQRRAARKARENAEWERKKERMRQEKEEFEQMKKDWAKERREYGASYEHFASSPFGECRCPQCRFGDRFSSRGGAFYFNIGGMPFRFRFSDYDSDDDDDSFFGFDSFDETWERRIQEEKEEENRKQASILGVSPDADAREIKTAYRKMALQYHPDKWRIDSDHGMSKDDAENQFKAMQSAYDHLMSNFDD